LDPILSSKIQIPYNISKPSFSKELILNHL